MDINLGRYGDTPKGNRQGTWTFEFTGPSGRTRSTFSGRWSLARQSARDRASSVQAEEITLVQGPDGGIGVVDGGPVEVLDRDTNGTAAVMFVVPKPFARQVAFDATEGADEGHRNISAEDMHITLVHLGSNEQQTVDKEKIVRALQSFAQRTNPISGIATGWGFFDKGDERVTHVLFDSADLPEFRAALTTALMDEGVSVDRTHGFIPHITLAYAPTDSELVLPKELPKDTIQLDTLSLYWGDGERSLVSLKSTEVLVPEDYSIPEDEDELEAIIERKPPTMDHHKSDTLIAWGGPIKALGVKNGVGTIGGQLVLFGAPDTKDLTGDWFSVKTYFGPRGGNGCDTMVHHGIPLAAGLEEYADLLLSPLKATRNKLGVWAEVALKLSDDFEKKIYELARKGVWKWSSGTADHMIKKDNTGQILRWPIIEGSLTPTPAEPRMLNHRLAPLKALLDIEWVLKEDHSAAAIVDAQLKAILQPDDDEVQRQQEADRARGVLALQRHGRAWSRARRR